MDNPKNDRYYLDRLLNDLHTIIRHMAGVTEETFSADEVLQDAMMFRLIQVSENAQKLSPEYKALRPQIPWRDVYGLRNRIVHDYGAVDLRVVYLTLAKDIPNLIDIIREDDNRQKETCGRGRN